MPGTLVMLEAIVHAKGEQPFADRDAAAALERLGWMGPVVVLAPSRLGGRPLPREAQDRERWVQATLGVADVRSTAWEEPAVERRDATEEEAAAAWRSLRASLGDPDWLISVEDGATAAAARRAGLSVIRIGPRPRGPIADVSRPDYEARDLLDAVNHLLTRSTFSDPDDTRPA